MDKKIPNNVLLVGMYTGAGKTRGIKLVLEELKPTFIYLAPRHEVIIDNFLKEHMAFPHLMSRSRFLEKAKVTPYCLLARNDPRIADLLRQGKIDVASRCKTCQYYKDCDYWQTRQIIELSNTSWFGVHAHIPSYLGSHFLERDRNTYDLVIIDENPFQSLFSEQIVSNPSTTRMIDDVINYNEIPESQFMVEALIGMRMNLVDGPSVKHYEKALELAKKEKVEKFLSGYNDAIINSANLPYKNMPNYDLVKTVTQIFQKSTSIEDLGRRLRLDKWQHPKIRLMDYNGESMKAIRTPMIILDATANVSIWQTLLGSGYLMQPPVFDKWKHRYVTHFVGGGEFFKSTWEKKLKDGEDPLGYKIIKRLCLVSPNGVLMTGHKGVLEKIIKKLADDGISNAHAIWHYGLTSDNNYWEKCDTIAVVSKPVIPPVAKEMYSTLTGLLPEHLDYIFTESEIMQAIGRVRQAIEQTTAKLPEGHLVGEKTRRERHKVQIVIFPELASGNPFDDQENYSSYHYNRISPYSYLSEILERGYISVFDCKIDLMKKAVGNDGKLKSELREAYPFRDFDSIFNFLLMNEKIIKRGNRYEWTRGS
jgi:hypothetical protein